MPIDFPPSPTTNQEYTYNNISWKWNGSSWLLVDSVSNANPIVSGDRGDITVSESGTVWTINNGSVTPAKLSTGGPSWDTNGNLTLTDKELQRSTLKDYCEVTSSPTISSGTLVIDLDVANVFNGGVDLIAFKSNLEELLSSTKREQSKSKVILRALKAQLASL